MPCLSTLVPLHHERRRDYRTRGATSRAHGMCYGRQSGDFHAITALHQPMRSVGWCLSGNPRRLAGRRDHVACIAAWAR